MSIRRSARRDHFVVINQLVFDDERLDHRELGVLTYLLSKPDNWRTNSHQLSSRFHCNISTMKGILSRLESLGYLLREKHRKADGTFFWESTVFEVPTMGQKTSDGKTSDGKTSDGKSAPITNNEVTITELTKTDQEEEPDDFSENPQPAEPFYTGQARQLAREVVKVQREFNAPKNFITDAPWGKLADEVGKDPLGVWQEFERYMIAVHSDKKDPVAYVGKIATNLYQNPGTEHACKPWNEFAEFFKKNLSAPPPRKKAKPRQPKLIDIPDREASARAIREARHG